MQPEAPFDPTIATLGPRTLASPLPYTRFVADDAKVLYNDDPAQVLSCVQAGRTPVAFELAGPRERVFFDSRNTKAAIVTCGGLCPGLNDVIRAIVHELYFMYGVRNIRGVRYGYAGLNPAMGHAMLELTPERIHGINEDGGTFLGSSRGPQPVDVMVDTLVREDIRALFVIGGDGTLKGARAIFEEITRRDLRISVIGVPKTIDNDIHMVSRTFGFLTAVSKAVESLRCAHVEATGAQRGVGIVKLMGRRSGFVAANAALAEGDANFVLVPEVPFELDGPKGLLAALERRLDARGHALIVVAEGAGQDLFDEAAPRTAGGVDASGNRKLRDIGVLLKTRVTEHFEALGKPATVKYIDPSYIIRSVPADANDRLFCTFLGQNAVHAAMAGKSGMVVSRWNGRFVHMPLELATRARRRIDPDGALWRAVLEATGQPDRMVND